MSENKELQSIIVAEYAQRLVDEMPTLLDRVAKRTRKYNTISTKRIAEGVIAHSGTLPSLIEALEDFKKESE
jgi:hypothetical protein